MNLSFSAKIFKTAPIFLFYLLCIVGLQIYQGAYSNEFGGHPDEAGHYVTGLMVRDFLLSGSYGAPVDFAEQFYLHYPKVALGHWPPFFYLLQALWSILFTASRTAMMVLMASITALFACCLQQKTQEKFSAVNGFVVGLLLVVLPQVQHFTSMLMAELLVALLCFWAVNSWAKYLQTEKTLYAACFGIIAALAILTKGNALLLGFVPVVSVLLCGRTNLLSRKSFWLPLFLVIAFCGPLTWLTLDMVKNGWQQDFNGGYFFSALPFYLEGVLKITGPVVVVLAVAGGIKKLWLDRKNGFESTFWLTHVALILSTVLFHSLVPSGQAGRHLLTAVPSLLLFFVAGVELTVQFVSKNDSNAARLAGTSLLFLPVILSVFQAQKVQACFGFKPVVTELSQSSEQQDKVLLVASDSVGEGMFVAEVAQSGVRPGHYALRTSKLLSTSRWDGSEYRLRFAELADVHAYLQEIPVDYLFIDKSLSGDQHRAEQLQVQELVQRYPEFYRQNGVYPLVRRGERFEQALWVYRLNHAAETVRPVKLDIDMRHMLGRSLRQ